MNGVPWRTLRWSLCLWGSGVFGGLIFVAGSAWVAVALALASTGLVVLSAVGHDRDALPRRAPRDLGNPSLRDLENRA